MNTLLPDFAIDLWSVAAILPELRTSFPAFPGESSADQLACIADVLGRPPPCMYDRCTQKERYFSDTGALHVEPSPRGTPRLPSSRSIDIITNARRKDADFVDFLSRCLRWVPEERLSLVECLQHPWLCEDSSQVPPRLEKEKNDNDANGSIDHHLGANFEFSLTSGGGTPVRADSAYREDEIRAVVTTTAVAHD